jgi:hypothetical protein
MSTMSNLSLSGRVVRSTDLAPLPNVAVRLIGPAAAFAGLPGVQPVLQGRQLTWTRQLSGFAGTRWECWVAHVQNQVQGITWEQFRDGALIHNPALNPEHLYKADQTYLIPEDTAAPPYAWTRQLGGFAGTRWECWVAHVQNQVQGITWEQFRDNALAYNPQLNADGRLFKAEKAYLIPQNDATPRAYLETTADAQGGYTFALGTQPAVCELQVEVDDYARFVMPLVVNGVVNQPVTLTPQSNGATTPTAKATSGSIRSARTDYASLPEKVRRVIDQVLFMLGDDAQVFDALPPDLRKMPYGARFLSDPGNRHYKDIVCADLVSITFKGAGLDITWGGGAGPSMADYYFPEGNAKLIEITDPNDWLPGDVLVYGPSSTAGRKAGHVNLYVGPFTGTDRSGKTYNLSDGAEVVDASMDFMMNGKEVGTGISGRTLQLYCLQKKCYTYSWVRRVRLRELAATFGR